MASETLKLVALISFLSLILPLMSHTQPSPYDFIKHLQGYHKGEKVKGLHKLKDYLKIFGYLDYQHSKHPEQALDDDFDDVLESAVKMYQINYHLNVTGILDAKTVSTMTIPRCGVPDIMNGTNWMKNGKKRSRHLRSTFIHAISKYSFFQGNPKWPKTALTYAFDSNVIPQAVTPVANAFNTWASVTDFTFSQVQNVETFDILISFFSGGHDDGSFDGPGGELAHAYAPTGGRLHFDADESWSVGPVAGSIDLGTVALHEIGHLLGLQHSSVEAAIMWPTIARGENKGLNADDIEGIRALYNIV